MKKYIYVILSVLVLLGIAYFSLQGSSAPANDSPNKRETITIGIMMPLSGDFGAIGEGLGKASELAIKDWKKMNPNVDVKIVKEDDKFDVKTGIVAYSKMTNIDSIDGMIMVSTPVLDAHHTQMRKDGIPVMSIGLQNDGVAPDNIFQLTSDPALGIKQFAEYIDRTGNIKKLAIVHANTLPALITFYNSFTSVYTKDSIDFMINSVDDAKTVAVKIKNANVDGIVIMTMPGTGAALTKNLLQLGVDPKKVKFYYDGQLTSGWSEYEKQLGDMKRLDGTNAIQFSTSDLTAFNTKFKAEYGTDPTVFSEYGYDGMKALLEAYNPNKKAWVNSIQSANVDAYSGKLTFDANGLRIQDVAVGIVSGGKLVKI